MNKIYLLCALLMVFSTCRVDEGDNDDLNNTIWVYRDDTNVIAEIHTLTFNRTTFKYYITEEVTAGDEITEYILTSYSGTYLYNRPVLHLNSIRAGEQILRYENGQFLYQTEDNAIFTFIHPAN